MPPAPARPTTASDGGSSRSSSHGPRIRAFSPPSLAGTVRIFILGGSAAMGTPDPSFNFGQILGVMLRQQYPGVQFEVVNAAMTAINSHVTVEIARDCAAREPDLFVVYLGNNEVIGPYGPGTVFQRWSPSLSMIRASLWVKSTRLGQLLGNVADCFRGKRRRPGPLAGHGDVPEQPGSGRRPSTGGRLRQLSAEPDRYLPSRPAAQAPRSCFRRWP